MSMVSCPGHRLRAPGLLSRLDRPWLFQQKHKTAGNQKFGLGSYACLSRKHVR